MERHDGRLTLPKGHVNQREELADAALREIHEETGLAIQDLSIEQRLDWYLNPIVIQSEGRVVKVIFYFLVRFAGGFVALTTDNDHAAARWYELSDTKRLSFAYLHVSQVLEQAAAHFKTT